MLYSLLYTLAMLLAAPLLLLSARARSKYLPNLAKRLGLGGRNLNPDGKPAIWLHAVSVGEALAARTLVGVLRKRLPGHAVYVSTTTTTGQEIAATQLDADGVFYFPFDWKFAVRRALRATAARLCVVMETELWPNFIRTLSRRGVPLVLANGRISDRSFRFYRRLRALFGPLLRRYHTLCAQSDLDAERLIEIGARPCDVVATGNLKYGREQFEVPTGTVEGLSAALALDTCEPVFLAGSTHAGEEEEVLAAFRQARRVHGGLRLVLAPRKPERFDAVAETLERDGYDFARYSELQDSPRPAPVVLVDAIGVLKPLYRLATVAFVGGSLVRRGGHNLLEASAAGVPVLFGPHMHNFRAVADDVLRRGAGRRVDDGAGLAAAALEILGDEGLRDRMGRGAAAVLEGNQEALPLTVQAVVEALVLGEGGALRGTPSLPVRFLAGAHAALAGVLRRRPQIALRGAQRLQTPTVSVGGLSFGGAGKTPMVALLAREFAKRGERVAVLTRGYGGRSPEPLVVSDGETVIGDPRLAGDEPLMLARALPGVIVVRDRNRLRAGRLAEERWRPTLFLLDDGFQHRRIGRDFDLIMLDADTIVGPRHLAQRLREPLRFATAADAIVILDGGTRRAEHAAELLRGTGVEAPIFTASFRPVDCARLGSGEKFPLERLERMRLLAFCGIGAPGRFAATLAGLGVRPVGFTSFRDHYPYSADDLERLERLLKDAGGEAMITTEKDAQRLGFPAAAERRILVLRVRPSVDRFEELFGLIERSLGR